MFQSILFERSQRGRINVRVAPKAYYNVIAAILALRTDYSRNPPGCRVIEKQAFHNSLANVHQIIQTPDMRQFVQKDRFYMIGRQAR